MPGPLLGQRPKPFGLGRAPRSVHRSGPQDVGVDSHRGAMQSGKGASSSGAAGDGARSRSREEREAAAATRGRSGALSEELGPEEQQDDFCAQVVRNKMEAKFDSQFRATTQGLEETVAALDTAQRDRLARVERRQRAMGTRVDALERRGTEHEEQLARIEKEPRADIEAEERDRRPFPQALRGNTTALVEVAEVQRALNTVFEGHIVADE